MKPISIFVISLLAATLPAQTLRTESDIHGALTEGWISYESYLLLLNLAENKLAPCGPLDELLFVPEVGEEDIAALENLCKTGARPPANLYDKTTLFVDWGNETSTPRSAADYRFTRDLADTATAGDLEHRFSMKYAAPHLEVLSEARANAFGEGYFTRNFISVKKRGPLSELSLGNFRRAKGLGLTLGGAPLPYAYAPEAPGNFRESFLLPRNTLPNGAYAEFRAGNFSPFAFALLNDDPYSSTGLNRTLGGGVESGTRAWQLGLLALTTRVRTPSGRAAFAARATGLYGSYRRPDLTAKTEMALSESGWAAGFEAVARDGAWEAGSGARAFSKDYLDPAGRGRSFFYARTAWLPADGDSLPLRGLRRGEREVDAFLNYKGSAFSIRPSLAVARSDVYGEERLEAALRETVRFPWKESRATLWQSATFRDTGHALPTGWEARARAESRPWRHAGLSLSARGATQGPNTGQGSAGVKIHLLNLQGIELSAGWTHLWTWNSGERRGENEIRLEERSALPGRGELKVYTLFSNGFHSPKTLGVSLNESF